MLCFALNTDRSAMHPPGTKKGTSQLSFILDESAQKKQHGHHKQQQAEEEKTCEKMHLQFDRFVHDSFILL